VTLRIPAFIVVGGGEIGAGYARQLLRAAQAGRLETDRILVADRDAACAAARLADPRVRLEQGDWGAWLDAHLDQFGSGDHFVPYHWAPHLLVAWLARQAERAGRTARRGGPVPGAGVPFERPTGQGDLALSYATWVCPPTCIEPALCPHTRGPKAWSLAADLSSGGGVDERIVFRSLHLVYGVATIQVGEILAARDRVLAARGARSYLVATSSHCHALAARLELS
jgi:hypothetical protein